MTAVVGTSELSPYIAEVENAVAAGTWPSQEFATLRGISISNASERFRRARRLGWIVPEDGNYLPRVAIRYVLAPSRSLT